MKKNLILCFSSLRPVGFTEEQLTSREVNYNVALEWLFKVLPSNWDVVYSDNTLIDISQIENPKLKEKLSKVNFLLHKENNGGLNKGAGEHDMCKKSFNSINKEDYNWITYFTARHIINSPWYFQKKLLDYTMICYLL